jgi:hypothetical protein
MNNLISPKTRPPGSEPLKPSTVPFFVVQESNFLIAQDIIASLQSRAPCRTAHVIFPCEVMPALASESRVSAAFLEVSYDEVFALQLDTRLAELGALIVLTAEHTDEQQARSRGWGMLSRPFTEAMIHKELIAVSG